MIFLKRISVIGSALLLVLMVFVGMQIPGSAMEPLIAEANGPYESSETASVLLDASGSLNPNGRTLQYRWNIKGIWMDWTSSPYFEYIWFDDYSGVVTLEVSDGTSSAFDTADVNILNIPPYNISVEGPIDPVNVGATVFVTLRFFDGDLRDNIASSDTYTAIFTWGDDSFTTYSLDVREFMVMGSHEYSQAGDYNIMISLSDDDGGISSGLTHVIVVSSAVSVDTLLENVEGLNIQDGVKNSLLSKLESARASLDHNQLNAAINKLEGFIKEVKAQRGKKLDMNEADVLIATAQQIIGQLKDR